MSLLFRLANIINSKDVPNLPQVGGDKSISSGLMIVYEIVGALAFLMVMLAALRYVLNSDDPAKISDAKRMIFYTFVGVAVITLAATIVGYVLSA